MSSADYFNPHSCEHCSQLLVDFTKPKKRKITFEITRLDAESFAGNGCALFASLTKSAWDSHLYSNGSKLAYRPEVLECRVLRQSEEVLLSAALGDAEDGREAAWGSSCALAGDVDEVYRLGGGGLGQGAREG